MKHIKDCPLCGKNIESDATATEYCALCSMIIKDAPAAVIRSKQRNKYLCSERCYNKYKQFHKEARS